MLRRDGSPAEDATVLIVDSAGPYPDIAAVTGPDGRFRFDDLAPGSCKVLATLEAGDSATAVYRVQPGATAQQDIQFR